MSLLAIDSNYSLSAPLKEPKTPAIIQHLLPVKLILEAFKFLSIEGLGRSSCVCKGWCKLESTSSYDKLWQDMNLTNALPILKIDKLYWEKHAPCEKLGIDPSGAPEPKQSKRGIKFLKGLSKRVEDGMGLVDFTIPRGLCFQPFFTLEQTKGEGLNFNLCTVLQFEKLAKFEDQVIPKTQRVFLTRHRLKDSHELSRNQQKALLNQIRSKMPNAIAVMALAILGSTTFLKDFEQLSYRGCIGEDNYIITYADYDNTAPPMILISDKRDTISAEEHGVWAMIEASDVF